MNLDIPNGTLGGNAKIFNTGVVDTSFAAPAATFTPGAVPVVLSVDTVVNDYPDVETGLASNDAIFEVDNDFSLFTNVDGKAVPASSLDIAAGVTATFSINDKADDLANLEFDNDIRNSGNLTVALLGPGLAGAEGGGSLTLNVDSYIGAVGSTIALDGQMGAGNEFGGDGGNLIVNYNSTLNNQGAVHARGGNGGGGGGGGTVSLSSDGLIFYNTGAIDVSGGSGTATDGGDGGVITLSSGYQSFDNSGALTANGGASDSGNAGLAGSVVMIADEVGSLRNSGTISVKGGACTGSASCNGGGGGKIEMEVYAGDLLNSGDLDVSGTDGGNGGNGGKGGNIKLSNSDGDSNEVGDTAVPTGSIRVSGDVTASGGNGAVGGGGGFFVVELTIDQNPLGQEIALFGYTDIIMNGGAVIGGGSGGDGGKLSISQDNPWHTSQQPLGPAGAVINYANVTANGGDGANGGIGGAISFSTQTGYYFGNPEEFAANFGAITLTGGASSGDGGDGGRGGSVALEGVSGVQNSGTITIGGGDAPGVGSTGGTSGQVFLGSDNGPVQNSAAITSNGGAALGDGGIGGGGTGAPVALPPAPHLRAPNILVPAFSVIRIEGNGVTNTAALTCNGGTGGELGGIGGRIILYSSPNGPTMNTGALSVAGGAGDDAADSGSIGDISIDGEDVTP